MADRNGSLETNESSSPEHSQNSDDDHINGVVNQRRHLHMEARTKDMTAAGGAGESFDLNDIFIKNIPGLSVRFHLWCVAQKFFFFFQGFFFVYFKFPPLPHSKISTSGDSSFIRPPLHLVPIFQT